MIRYKQKLKEKISKSQVETFLKDIKYIQVNDAEGTIEYSDSVKNKKFKSVKDIEKFLDKVEKPDMGYNKHFITIMFKDGNSLKSFRYDHGLKDGSFGEQLSWYLENNVSMDED